MNTAERYRKSMKSFTQSIPPSTSKGLQELTRMHCVVRANYPRGAPVDKAFLRKTARLVQKHTQTGEVHETEESTS